jgi:L-seryl-tRNA(Ser) seleniumtransferase
MIAMKPRTPTDSDANRLRALPSVNALLASPALAELADLLPRTVLTAAARAALEAERDALRQDPSRSAPDLETIAVAAAEQASKSEKPSFVLNATGVVLHTGLGRARLAREAQDAVSLAAGWHSQLEIEPETGRRGSRQSHVRSLLCELTGSEDALVVNNCAGAVLLAVSCLAAGREVIISRGELVEIGGAFRMPDIIRASGARMIEVGTTNRTRISDYAAAISVDTALILRCHPSNFAMVGFTESASLPELAALGRQAGIPVMDDQGAGLLIPSGRLGIPASDTLSQSVATGCSIVAASGDKLLGGPQAGIILGKREAVSQLAKHPLARALRIDKLTLAALEATLRLYRNPETAIEKIPTLRYLTRSGSKLRTMAKQLLARTRAATRDYPIELSIAADHSEVGGGSLPGAALPTFCLVLRPTDDSISVDALARRLRMGSPPLFARIREGAILIDPRTLEDYEIPLVAELIGRALEG